MEDIPRFTIILTGDRSKLTAKVDSPNDSMKNLVPLIHPGSIHQAIDNFFVGKGFIVRYGRNEGKAGVAFLSDGHILKGQVLPKEDEVQVFCIHKTMKNAYCGTMKINWYAAFLSVYARMLCIDNYRKIEEWVKGDIDRSW